MNVITIKLFFSYIRKFIYIYIYIFSCTCVAFLLITAIENCLGIWSWRRS